MVSANRKQSSLWTHAMASITQRSTGQMQGNSNKMHNQLATGVKTNKRMSSETKQTKTS